MKKFLLFLFMAFAYMPVRANIAVSPFYLEFDADTSNRSDHARFTNTSDKETTYNIKIINYKQDKNGSYSFIDEPIESNPFASPYLDYSPRQVTLKPMESQVVRVQRKGMATADKGEYVSHLLIQEVPPDIQPVKSDNNSKNISINLRAIYGVSIPIMITKGDVSATGRIKSIKIESSKGQYFAKVTVERFGTRSFNGTIVVKDGKTEIGRVNNFRIFMSTPERVLHIPLGQQKPRDVRVILISGRDNETLETKNII